MSSGDERLRQARLRSCDKLLAAIRESTLEHLLHGARLQRACTEWGICIGNAQTVAQLYGVARVFGARSTALQWSTELLDHWALRKGWPSSRLAASPLLFSSIMSHLCLTFTFLLLRSLF